MKLGNTIKLIWIIGFCGLFILAGFAMLVWVSIGKVSGNLWMDVLIGALFIGVGTFAIIGTYRQVMRDESESKRKAARPNEPWLARPDWEAGEIRSSVGNDIKVWWPFAIVWNSIMLPLTIFVLPKNIHTHDAVIGVPAIVVMQLVGLCLAAKAIMVTRRWRNSGHPVLKLATIPASLGGFLNGNIELDKPLNGIIPVELTLTCLLPNNKRGPTISWSKEQIATPTSIASIPVSFLIPVDEFEYQNGWKWTLSATAKTYSGKFVARFDVPVFRVAQTTAEVSRARSSVERERRTALAYQRAPDSWIEKSPTPAGTAEYRYQPRWGIFRTLAGIFCILCAAGFGWLLLWFGAPKFVAIMWWSALFAVFVSGLWTSFSRICLRIADGTFTIHRSLWGIKSVKTVLAAHIESIKPWPAPDGRRHDLLIRTKDTGYIRVGVQFADKAEAEWLLAELKTTLQLPN